MSNITLSPKLTHGFKDYRPDIWGDSYNWASKRASGLVKWLVIHHTVTRHDATPDDIAELHRKRGWGGVGYHLIIDKKGKVWYVGDLSTSRANVKNKNDFVIGVSLIGDFTKHLPSDEQIVATHELCKFILFDLKTQFPNLKGWDSLVGHKDLQATQCPGTSWNVKSGMKDRIINNIPYSPQASPVPPTPSPTPPPVSPSADYATKDDVIRLEKEVDNLATKFKGFEKRLKKLSLSVEKYRKALVSTAKKIIKDLIKG